MVGTASFLKEGNVLFRLFLSGQPLDQIEGVTVVLLRLGVGINFAGIVAGLYQVRDSPGTISASLEVHGQLRREAGGRVAIPLDQILAGLPGGAGSGVC